MTAFKPLVFSGVQPTGNLHLGNYLGAIRRFAQLQASHDCIYCVVDQHAITTWQDPVELIRATREVTAAFLAAGIDPKRNIVFNQSRVVQHAELAWIFNCVARMGWLSRMTQFKEKAGKDRENASVGLFAYPTLMAADILAYRATHVPVGDDQKQHLELTRDIAQKFNNDFSARIADLGVGVEMKVGEETVNGFFPLTEPLIEGPAPRVMSLRDGSKKMSKSDPSDLSRINLTDDADTIARKIRKAKTDPAALPSELEGLKDRPEAENLVVLYAALAETSREAVLADFGGRQFSEFKPALADLAVDKLAPIAGEMRRISADPVYVDSVLQRWRQARRRAGRGDDEDGPRDRRVPRRLISKPFRYGRLPAVAAGGRLPFHFTQDLHGFQTPQPGSRPPPEIPGHHRRDARMRARRRLCLAPRQEHQRRAGAALCHRARRFPALAGRREDHARGGAMRRRSAALDAYAGKVRQTLGIEPELVVREGKPAEEIHKLIEEDQDIAILVLAAGASKEGPGPLVASIAGKGAAFPIPVTVVPQNLSDEEIDSLA